MKPRTIVEIDPIMGAGAGDSLLVKVKSPIVIPDAEKWQVFDCDPDAMPPWTQAGSVREHGLILRQKLTSHPAIASAIQHVLSTPLASRHPVYFKVQASDAERLRWEALWDEDQEFLALDARWPIARIAESQRPDAQHTVHPYAPPLRVMALLSALGRPAKPQWKELHRAVEKARELGLAVELAVFFGEEELLQEVREEIAQGTLPGVQAAAIGDPAAIEEALDAFAPHILHFYCHGSANVGKPQLELAKITDHDLGKSSVILGISKLAGFPALRNVWLVTLNCCEGGKAAANLHSMAHQLVANVVPAAVGMLEPIDAGDAHKFCGAFYTAVFRAVREIENSPAPGNGEIEWVETLHPPRSLLAQPDPGPLSRVEWTLPVLYVRPERFEVKLEALPAPELLQSMRLRAEAIATVLRGMAATTPDEVRDDILATLADLPPSLRPDRNGNFPGGA